MCDGMKEDSLNTINQTEPHEPQAELYTEKPHTLPYTVYDMDDDMKTIEEMFEDLL